MRAELERAKAWLTAHTVRPRLRTPLSQFLLSSCCDAPVVQHDEGLPALLPVLCSQCDTELGAPGIEDVARLYKTSWLCGWESRHGRWCFEPRVTVGFDAASSDEQHMVWVVTTPDDPSHVEQLFDQWQRRSRVPRSGTVEVHTEPTRWSPRWHRSA